MITPNKALTLDQSALGLISSIAAQGPGTRDLVGLYHDVANQCESIDQFLFAMDVMYLIARLDVDLPTRTVTYAK